MKVDAWTQFSTCQRVNISTQEVSKQPNKTESFKKNKKEKDKRTLKEEKG
jgi:hypothetical protein